MAKRTARKTRGAAGARPRGRSGRRRASSSTKSARKSGRSGSARKIARTKSKKRAARAGSASRRRLDASKASKAMRPKPAALNRERRRLREDETVPTPPSTLDFERKASQAASGRAAIRQQRRDHTETGPDLTAGDVDAEWGEAYADGDEAPGGDNPTP